MQFRFLLCQRKNHDRLVFVKSKTLLSCGSLLFYPLDSVCDGYNLTISMRSFSKFLPLFICSCGSCGYPLNLTSSDRITSGIGSEYRKSIKKGFMSFLSVDLSRFTQVDQVNCFPVAWGRKRLKTKLLCRKCGVHIGYGYGDSLALCGFDSPNLSTSSYKKFTIKIRALQPSEDC